MNKKEKQIIGLTTSSHALVHLFEGVLPPLIPLIMFEFNTDYFHLGIIVSVFSYAFGLGSLPAGFLADKTSPKRLITIFLFGSGIFAGMILQSSSLLMYGILMGIIGGFCSIYHPASNTLIAHTIREKGRGFGLHGIAGSLGVAIVPALSAWIGSTMGWRASHVLFGAVAICIGIFSLIVPNNVLSGVLDDKKTKSSEKRKIPYKHVILFFLSVSWLGLTYKGILTFLPIYLGENVHFSFFTIDKVALGGTVATLSLLSGALGQYITGRLTDKYRPELLYFICITAGTVVVFMISFTSNLLLILSSILYAFFYFAAQPVQNYIISAYLPAHRHGLGYGIHFLLTFGVGSTAAVVSGYIADYMGLAYIFHIMGICFAISAIIGGILFFTKPYNS